jgi:hypothetical protein
VPDGLRRRRHVREALARLKKAKEASNAQTVEQQSVDPVTSPRKELRAQLDEACERARVLMRQAVE